MKRLLFTSAATLLLSLPTHAINYANFEEYNESTTPDQIVIESVETQRVFTQNRLKVKTHMRNFLSKDQIKVRKAEAILEHIINSDEFREKVLAFTWRGKKQFNSNNGLSNQEIYDHLLTGEEILMPNSSGVMDFDLSLYRSKNPWSKVKGYTTGKSMRIYMNKKFFRKSSWTPVDVAANMAHEWVHKMGYGHDYRHNQDRPSTVPYAIGHIVTEIATEFGY
jgi:hypothetical protein